MTPRLFLGSLVSLVALFSIATLFFFRVTVTTVILAGLTFFAFMAFARKFGSRTCPSCGGKLTFIRDQCCEGDKGKLSIVKNTGCLKCDEVFPH